LVLSASLERDCFVRTADDPPSIYVGSVVVDPQTLDSLCCVGRGRRSPGGCWYGCRNAELAATAYWTSDNPLHGTLCFVQCYWF
jgi:hypothetical protein